MSLPGATVVVLPAVDEPVGKTSVPAATVGATVGFVEVDDVLEHADARTTMITGVEHHRAQSIWQYRIVV